MFSFIYSFTHSLIQKLVVENQHVSSSPWSPGPASVSGEVLGVRNKPGA